MKKTINFILPLLIIFSITSTNANNQNLKKYSCNGTLSLAERIFIGNKKDNLHNGAYIKALNLEFLNQVSKDLHLNLGLDFDAPESKVEVSNSYITYTGFKGLKEQLSVSIGKISPSFSLENHSDPNWSTFLENSISTTPFAPSSGLGVSMNKWQDDYSINVSWMRLPREQMSDVTQVNFRGTKAYFFDEKRLLQLGFYGNFKYDGYSDLEFSTIPEAKSRFSTDFLLNTTINDETIKAKNHYSLGIETMFQNGPFIAQSEGIFTRVNRDKNQSNKNLNFKSYYIKFSYILTGGFKEFEPSQGVIGRIIPEQEGNIWEIGSRYSFLNLNSKDILGGIGKIIGISLTCYYNNNISVTGEYLKNYIKSNNTLEKRYFDSIGCSIKLRF